MIGQILRAWLADALEGFIKDVGSYGIRHKMGLIPLPKGEALNDPVGRYESPREYASGTFQ